MSSDLQIKLDIYQGPLALLLHLIKKNEVSIHDIPVALITAQYLSYLEEYKDSIDLNMAGDFLIMAATLVHIKSKMLLPETIDADGNVAEDPRLEIVRPLLEYAACQAAAETLGDLPMLDRDFFTRGGSFLDALPNAIEEGEESREVNGSLYDLISAWRDLAGRKEVKETCLNFTMETKTIAQKLQEIRDSLLRQKSAHFLELAGKSPTTFELSLSFLAVLELARTGFLRMFQDLERDQTGP
ncbi:MAG: segregation/condensation protein A, partial [Deltaproteobacteria bacterium]|nr:segregation/condensation protein A [Deltaproteobacteria bacterium]